jgi:phosphomethylpyrimidine synthase
VALETERKKNYFEKITFDDIWDVLKKQAEDGVDFFTIHAGILKKSLKMLENKKRVCGIVSRGGAILARWMHVNKKENPFYENFDKILDLAKKYNITLSLGDALRPGAIADSTDRLQISELHLLGELVKKCRKKRVQVMVEGPGHIRLDEIALNMFLEKKICDHAPFYVLGPLPTDIAAGYDHITGAIGGALAAFYGADFLCVVTPAEHLRHPSLEDIKEGVIASRIAAHSVDILRFKDEWEKDYKLSLHRARRKWEKIFSLTIDENKAREYRISAKTSLDMCTMCGRFCSLKIIEQCGLLK